MIHSINNINHGKVTSIACFDISTLYRTIPHDKLIKALFEIIDFLKEIDKWFITVGKYGARSLNNEKQGSLIFSQSSLKRLWNNCITAFSLIWKQMFRQVTGSPMGSDPASFFVNYFFESKWINKMKYKMIENTFRFIDVLTVLSDNCQFE